MLSLLTVFLETEENRGTSFIKEFNAPNESASRVRLPRVLHNYVSMLYGNDVTKARARARGRRAAFRHCKLKLRKCAMRVIITERAR